MNRNRQPRSLKYFLAEIAILVLGISVSFLLNEWRMNQREQAEERDLLESFRSDLISDSTYISGAVKTIENQIERGNKVLANNSYQYSDSLRFQVLTTLNYVPFRTNDITYEGMKSVGASALIKNDSLRSQIIGIYENGYQLLQTWTGIDSEHVRLRLIPYVESNFPYAPAFDYSSKGSTAEKKFVKAVQADEFKHLVQFGTSYKINSKAIFELLLAELKETIEMIDRELGEG